MAYAAGSYGTKKNVGGYRRRWLHETYRARVIAPKEHILPAEDNIVATHCLKATQIYSPGPVASQVGC